ncbi:fatty acid hydroxylase family protein [Nitrospirillum amazonense]|uniref:Fatty acid hydroxylase family protein n=1 Tax=Nitrospirillum amazonense TaxID=28077 RepID=A0A560EHR3_9PROT|nr:sterol desaturase family protein [Nitrospirillum amazonense]TWB08886.1 fatty acid hydroxylase family protein [Nitrospirillum amazonense]
MAQKLAWGRAWHGRSYDLGRMTLADLWRAYLTYPAIQIYGLLAVAAAAYTIATARQWQGPALAVLAVFFVYPMAWFLIHRHILHGRWLYRMKWSASLWKRIHFDHHQDPHLLEVLFGSPANTLPTIALVSMPVGYVIGGWPAAGAALATGLATTCVYEFIHCIQHLNYKPKSRFIQKLKRDHLIHHFHNEDTNLGIVSFTPDRLFGTYFASARDCPKSATVFNLGYDLDEARRYPWVMEVTGSPPRDRPPTAFATSDTGGAAS